MSSFQGVMLRGSHSVENYNLSTEGASQRKIEIGGKKESNVSPSMPFRCGLPPHLRLSCGRLRAYLPYSSFSATPLPASLLFHYPIPSAGCRPVREKARSVVDTPLCLSLHSITVESHWCRARYFALPDRP